MDVFHAFRCNGRGSQWVALGALACGLGLTPACDESEPASALPMAGAGGKVGTAVTRAAPKEVARAEVGTGGGGTGGGDTGGSDTVGAGGSGAGDAGDAPNGHAPSGTIRVLSADPALRNPTDAAIRGTDLWVVNSQLTSALGGDPPVLPFNVVSIPLEGGSIGAMSIELPDFFYPESIAAHPDGTLFVGGLYGHTVLRVAANSTTPDPGFFALAERGAVGLTVDQPRQLLWMCDSTPFGSAREAALIGFSLADGSEVVRHVLPEPEASGEDAGADADAGEPDARPRLALSSFCNDVSVDSAGTLWLTESTFGRVLRIPSASALTPNSASVWLSDPLIATPKPNLVYGANGIDRVDDFGANGIELVNGKLVISSTNLVVADSQSKNPSSTLAVIELTEDGAPATLCGPDGLLAIPNTGDIVVVENGFCGARPGRVIRVTLDLG